MSDATPYKPSQWRKNRGTKVSLVGPPTAQDLAEHATRHKGDAADRFSLYTPEQIEEETRNVRLDTSFGDIIKIRDQWEMIAKVAEIIIKITREHDAGSILQRMNAHREADSLRRTLARLNGKKPRTNTYQER